MIPTQDGPFQIRLAEVETGIVLDRDGARAMRGGHGNFFECTTWEDALAEKDGLLRRFPFAEVWITDLSARRPPQRFVNEAELAMYLAARARWNRWSAASWLRRLFWRKPPNPRGST